MSSSDYTKNPLDNLIYSMLQESERLRNHGQEHPQVRVLVVL